MSPLGPQWLPWTSGTTASLSRGSPLSLPGLVLTGGIPGPGPQFLTDLSGGWDEDVGSLRGHQFPGLCRVARERLHRVHEEKARGCPRRPLGSLEQEAAGQSLPGRDPGDKRLVRRGQQVGTVLPPTDTAAPAARVTPGGVLCFPASVYRDTCKARLCSVWVKASLNTEVAGRTVVRGHLLRGGVLPSRPGWCASGPPAAGELGACSPRAGSHLTQAPFHQSLCTEWQHHSLKPSGCPPHPGASFSQESW